MSENPKKRSRKRTPAASAESSSPTPAKNRQQAEAAGAVLHLARSGQWMDPREMVDQAMERMNSASDANPDAKSGAHSGAHAGAKVELIFDVGGLEHLDASALQVLLAIRAEQRQRGGCLRLVNASGHLKQWFEYAGAAELLSADSAEAPAAPVEG